MGRIELEPLVLQSKDNDFIRQCHIKRVDSDNQVDTLTLWFQFDKSVTPPSDDDCDSYLLAIIMDAMSEGREIYVKGSVSSELLSNLCEFQAAWHKWLPNIYSQIDVKADYIRDDVNKVPGAICAFSGGVDAIFSVWRHSQSKFSHRSQKINFCSIVHGFDIPIEDEAAFNNARNRSQEALSDLGIELKAIKTNHRQVSRVNWEHSFSCALVATLSNFKKSAGTCIVGSGQPYDSLVIPWGSTPITDHLLSSDAFVAMHDGASHTRTEKVKDISGWKVGMDSLRVCWEGDLNDRNCGKCEKCLRTQFNFLVSGLPIPKSFPEGQPNVGKVTFKNDVVRGEWLEIYEVAQKHCQQEAWMPELRWMIRRESLKYFMLPKGSLQRKLVSSIRNRLRR